MPGSQDHLSTQEFAKKAGVSASTVSKWLRTNKITGQKKSGKWIISPSELSKVTSSPQSGNAPKSSRAASLKVSPSSKPKSGTKNYTIEEFSEMTYLTAYGVEKWLKEGRLASVSDDFGQPMVSADNLDQPHVKKLIR